MKCSLCKEDLPFDDDAVEQLIEAKFYQSATSLVSDHHHLRPHPEFDCPGDPEAIQQLAEVGVIIV